MTPVIQEEDVDLQQPTELLVRKPRKHWWLLILLVLLLGVAYFVTTKVHSKTNSQGNGMNLQSPGRKLGLAVEIFHATLLKLSNATFNFVNLTTKLGGLRFAL